MFCVQPAGLLIIPNPQSEGGKKREQKEKEKRKRKPNMELLVCNSVNRETEASGH